MSRNKNDRGTVSRAAARSPTRWLVLSLLVVAAIAGVALFAPRGPPAGPTPTPGPQATPLQGAPSTPPPQLTPATSWPHTHGLGVDGKNPGVLYIGTHGLGVVRLEKGGQPMRVGTNGLDLMGYAPHPINGDIQYSSGHPAGGGSVGVIKSEDGGLTWRRIDSMRGRPVDFHTMTVSPAKPDTLYAWYYGDGRFYRSTDGGTTWTNPLASGLPDAQALAADPFDENTVWAGTSGGLYKSADAGATWTPVESSLQGQVVALAINPKNPQALYASLPRAGVWKSTDGGKRFTPMNTGLSLADTAFHLAIDPVNPENVYAGLASTSIYGSADGGAAWQPLRRAG